MADHLPDESAPVVPERRSGSPVALHRLEIDPQSTLMAEAGRASIGLWRFDVERSGLVLGSTQPWSDVDHGVASSLGIEVGRRRSGGGAVLLWPRGQVWLDIVVPRGHPRWDDRVDVATHWIGEAWRLALAEFGIQAVVHRGGNQPGPLGSAVCFAGIGPGEVGEVRAVAEVGTSGEFPMPNGVGPARKLVGIAQRRQRAVARFQTSVAVGLECPWSAHELGALLRPASHRCGVAPTDLARAIAPVPLTIDADRLAEKLEAVIRAQSGMGEPGEPGEPGGPGGPAR